MASTSVESWSAICSPQSSTVSAARTVRCMRIDRSCSETRTGYSFCFVWNAVFSFDYKVAGDVAEALRRTVWAATYVIKKPLDAGDICRLWRIIQWSKVLLRCGENTLPWLEWPRGNHALPDTVEALLPSSSTFEDQGEEDDGSDLFKVVRVGGGRRRKLGDSHDGGSSSGGGVAGSCESKPLF